MIQAQAQYRGYGYNQGYGGTGLRLPTATALPLRRCAVTAITDVQRRNNGLRVTGLMSSGYAANMAASTVSQNRNYAQGDLSFRCNVDYRGAVTNVRIGRNEPIAAISVGPGGRPGGRPVKTTGFG